MNKSHLLCLICVCFFTVASTSSCNHDDGPNVVTQNTGSLSLTAEESIGSKCYIYSPINLLQGAKVKAIDTNGLEVTTYTDVAGFASLDLPPGIYDVMIEAAGHEPITFKDKQVFSGNDTTLGDVTFREKEDPTKFNQDRAILLALMSSVAYAPPGEPSPLGAYSRPWLDSAFTNAAGVRTNMPIPDLDYSDPYVTNSTFNLDTQSTEYLSCWQIFDFVTGTYVPGTRLRATYFIAYNPNTEDIMVSFRGSDESGDTFGSLAAFSAAKRAWTLRGADLAGTSDVNRAVNRDFWQSHNNVQDKLQVALGTVIGSVTDKNRSRVYFTGHSFGGAGATMAALDFGDYLVAQGYNRNNIIMYSYGAPRIITENLEPHFQAIVPNSFAVAAKEDLATHAYGRDADRPTLIDAAYTHIRNLQVLSTNIVQRKFDIAKEQRYEEIGYTRLEALSRGKPYEGCSIGGAVLDVPTSTVQMLLYNSRKGLGQKELNPPRYLEKGHDTLQYVRRLEYSNGGIPALRLKKNSNERVELVWNGLNGDGVMGPCDWVALYETTDDTRPTDYSSYSCFAGNGWQWVTNGSGYPLGVSTYETCRDPGGFSDRNKRYWIGYIDGFDRILKMQGPYRLICANRNILGVCTGQSRLQ